MIRYMVIASLITYRPVIILLGKKFIIRARLICMSFPDELKETTLRVHNIPLGVTTNEEESSSSEYRQQIIVVEQRRVITKGSKRIFAGTANEREAKVLSTRLDLISYLLLKFGQQKTKILMSKGS